MKTLYFIKWCWSKSVAYVKTWDRWAWAWMITCGWGPSAFLHRETFPASWHLFVLFTFAFWVLYGLIYTGIKRAYRKFQDEQERIVEHMKNHG